MSIPRRSFLFVPGAALGLNGAVPASERINVACIGTGWQGMNNLKSFLAEPSAAVRAVCDIDPAHLREAQAAAPDAQACREMDEVFERPDIDAVALSLPDHWHGIASVRALRAGKDVYGEKPLAHNFAEGREIVEAVARHGRVWQTGSWQRSLAAFRFACEVVRSGRIGTVRRVEVGLPGGHPDFDQLGHRNRPEPVPAGFDFDRWLGPAPAADYCPARVHKTWRWNFDYGGGMLLDWVGHHVDIAHWGMGADGSGPQTVAATGTYDARHPVWNTPVTFRVEAQYAGGVTMTIADDIRRGARFVGDEGWVWVDRSGAEASPRSVLTTPIRGSETHLYASPGHFRDFLECVRTRRAPACPAATALRSATPAYLGLISIQVGRPIRWDPSAQRMVGDA
ncbi:MAG TPA: gfo/Idh/MocA family oxidoreductase, partial [Solibacterales bacterium]|nr:gfo/Idh/MocA family oxidoreductase [Bryobacterales bacterium]